MWLFADECGLDAFPESFGRGDGREALGESDAELDLVELGAAVRAGSKMPGDALRLFRRELAVRVGREMFLDVLCEHHPSCSARMSDGRRWPSLRARILWPRLRREATVPFEQPTTAAISSYDSSSKYFRSMTTRSFGRSAATARLTASAASALASASSCDGLSRGSLTISPSPN